MRKTISRLILHFGLVGIAVIALASTPNRSPNANEVILAEPTPITIQVDQGQVLRLDSSATSVFIAQPEIADIQLKSPRLLYVYGKKNGQTSLFVMGGEQRIILARKVVVGRDIDGLDRALEQANLPLPPTVSSYEGGLTLEGVVPDATAALDIETIAKSYAGEGGSVVNQLDLSSSQQVHLRVKVAEVSRSATKRFGLQWEQVFESGASSLIWGFGGAFGEDVVTRGANVLAGDYATGAISGKGVLEALETEGLVTVLAEPNLTALSGETASFLVGGEIPIPTPSATGTPGVEFKNFGVSLSFTPVVLSENRISLRVRPEVSNVAESSTTIGGLNIPSITTRRAETTVELASGQSFAIGGLLQRDLNQSLNKLPGLANIPILGTLFRSNQLRDQETELVIIVTPYIVRPVSVATLATPGDGFRPASDSERIFGGHLYRSRIADGRSRPIGPDGGALTGAAGFIIE